MESRTRRRCPQLRLSVFALLGCLLPGWGCSWMFTKPPPPEYERGGYFECTTNRAPPVFDTLFTLTNVGSAIYVAGQDDVENKGGSVTAGLLVASIWMASAIYGWKGTSECEEAQADWGYRPRRRFGPRPARRVQPAPQPVAPGPPPSDFGTPGPTRPAPGTQPAPQPVAPGPPPPDFGMPAPAAPAPAPAPPQRVDDDEPN